MNMSSLFYFVSVELDWKKKVSFKKLNRNKSFKDTCRKLEDKTYIIRMVCRTPRFYLDNKYT